MFNFHTKTRLAGKAFSQPTCPWRPLGTKVLSLAVEAWELEHLECSLRREAQARSDCVVQVISKLSARIKGERKETGRGGKGEKERDE